MQDQTLPQIDGYPFAREVKRWGKGPNEPVQVAGNVDLEKWECGKPIRIEKVTFLGPVSFAGSKLFSVIFDECTFHAGLDCSGAEFTSDIELVDCSFEVPIGARRTAENASALFDSAQVHGDIYLKIDGSLSCKSAKIGGELKIAPFNNREVESAKRMASAWLDYSEVGRGITIGPSASKSRRSQFNRREDTLRIEQRLSLEGVRAGFIRIDRTHVKGEMAFRSPREGGAADEDLQSKGALSLQSASAGSLSLDEVIVDGLGANLNGSVVQGDVQLSMGGTLQCKSARIDGDFDLSPAAEPLGYVDLANTKVGRGLSIFGLFRTPVRIANDLGLANLTAKYIELDNVQIDNGVVSVFGCKCVDLAIRRTSVLKLGNRHNNCGEIVARAADVKGLCVLEDVATDGDVDLFGARIKGQFQLDRSNVKGTLKFNGSRIGSLTIGTDRIVAGHVFGSKSADIEPAPTPAEDEKAAEPAARTPPLASVLLGGLDAVDTHIGSYARVTRTRVTGVSELPGKMHGISFKNCTFDSSVNFWSTRIDGDDTESRSPDTPPFPDGEGPRSWFDYPATTIEGDLSLIECSIAGDLELTNTKILPLRSGREVLYGRLSLNGTRVRGKVRFGSPFGFSRRASVSQSVADFARRTFEEVRGEAQSHYRTTACEVSIKGVEATEIDLHGLDIGCDGRTDKLAGHLHADGVDIRGPMRLFFESGDLKEEEGAGYLYCKIEKSLKLRNARLGELHLGAHSFTNCDKEDPEARKDGVLLVGTSIGLLRIARQPDCGWMNGMPGPLDLSGLHVDRWEFDNNLKIADPNAKKPRIEANHLAFLDNDEVTHRDIYRMVAQTLRNLGDDDAAKRVDYTDNWRARNPGAWRKWRKTPKRGAWRLRFWKKKAWGPPGRLKETLALSRVSGPRKSSNPIPGFSRFFLRYGSNPMALFWVIGALAVLSLGLVSHDSRNFEPSSEAFLRVGSTSASETERARQAEAFCSDTGWDDVFWLTARYHIPVIGLESRMECEPADEALYLGTPVGMPFLSSTRGVEWRDGSYVTEYATAEDWFMLMAILNWIFWPILLTFLIRNVLSD